MKQFDLRVYGGTAGGVVAAVAADGLSVVLIEPGRHLGGMSSGGLGATDFGNTQVIGGQSREFYRRVGAVFGKPESWTFEPHVAECAYRDFVAEAGVAVLLHSSVAGASRSGRRITSIQCERLATRGGRVAGGGGDGLDAATMFIDASYEGDLMARAIDFTLPRAAQRDLRPDTVSPVQSSRRPVRPARRSDQRAAPADRIRRRRQARRGRPQRAGYNFQLCLTRQPDNRLPFTPPAHYDPGPSPPPSGTCWADNPSRANLTNDSGLPASPFRTDDWR